MRKQDRDSLLKELERLAETHEASAEEHAINGEEGDSRHCDGKATAYRHAFNLVEKALKKGGA